MISVHVKYTPITVIDIQLQKHKQINDDANNKNKLPAHS